MPRSYRPHDRDDQSGPHHQQSLPEVELEILRGRARRRFRPVEGPAFLIGTALDSDLVLGDPQFPDAHSYILVSAEGVGVRWLGVGPALSIDGHRVLDRAMLRNGDLLETGPYQFRVIIRERKRGSRPARSSKPLGSLSISENEAVEHGSYAAGEVEDLLSDIRQTFAAIAERPIPAGRSRAAAETAMPWRFFSGRITRRRCGA
jgi:hypothetical protein